MYINWGSNRKLEVRTGITFMNYKTSDFTLNPYLGEHEDMITARKIIREYHDSIDLNHLLATGEVKYLDGQVVENKNKRQSKKENCFEQIKIGGITI